MVLSLLGCSGELSTGGVDPETEAQMFGGPGAATSDAPGVTGGSGSGGDDVVLDPVTGEPLPQQPAANNGSPSSPSRLTYHADIRPLMERHCVGCHQPGEIGPYDLTDFASVTAVSALIRQSVSRLEMPPWAPVDGCGDFRHERRLTDEEVAMFVEWIDAGTPEGDPGQYAAPSEMTVPDIGVPDVTIEMEAPYRPAPPGGGVDDYRCFIIPLELGEPRALTGWEFVPSNREIAHHAAFWVVPNDAGTRADLEAADARDGGPGYTCFGDAGVASSGAPIGAWTPGDVPSVLPADTGFPLPASGFMILQMHYNVVNDAVGSDQTTVHLKLGPANVGTELSMVAIFDADLDIPAGVPEVTEGTTITLPQAVKVYGYLPHMHLIGTRIRLRAQNTCLIDIPEWDFTWQGTYLLEDPVTLPAGTRLDLECWYDNSMQNQPAGRTPVDVGFGDGTYDEMCGAGIIVGLP